MLRVSVRVPAAEAEIARALLLELAPTGFEEVTLGEQTELAAYTDGAGAQTIRSAFTEPVLVARVPDGW